MGTICLTLLILMQAQESVRLSKTVMGAAVLVFILGVSLLVYFFRRYKRTEKELQDEWDRPEQSLFAPSVPLVLRDEGQSLAEAAREASSETTYDTEPEPESWANAEPGPKPTADEPLIPLVAKPLTQDLQSDSLPVVLPPTPDTEVAQPQTRVLSSERSEAGSAQIEAGPAVIASAPKAEVSQHPTEVLSSEKQSDRPESDANTESPLLDDDIWAGLELPEPEAHAGTQHFGVEQLHAGGTVEQREQASVSPDARVPVNPKPPTDLLGAARVDSHSGREGFEPPGLTKIVHSEPLKPVAPESRTRILASPPVVSEQNADIQAGADADALSIGAPVVAPADASAIRVRAGSILGLPAERSHAPLVLGAPAKPRDEIGIGALSNYGRDGEGGGGHGGTIALATVILLLGGGIASYLFVPSVQSWVNSVVERSRGASPTPPPVIEQPKARIFAARNEANKNMVTARGAVDNISEETLSDLKIEVSLERGNGAEGVLQKHPIKPSQLAPKERGTFEFRYDGNRATGFGGYRIVRLLSGESEIKFTTPGRSG